MPRPKRFKVTPSIPISISERIAKEPVVASAAQKAQEIFSPTSSGRTTNGSDDSDGLVLRKRTSSGKKTSMAQNYTMSGALAPEDQGSTRLRPVSGQTRASLSKIVREADHAKAKEQKARARETQITISNEPDHIPSSIPMQSKGAEEPTDGVRKSSVRQNAQAGSASGVPSTPGFQSSMLGGVTFKKRPRQPSLLQLAQSQNNPPSEVNEDDMYNFLPDDESTPLIKSMSQPDPRGASSSSHQTSSSRKRKLKTPEVQVPASQTHDRPSPSSPASSQLPEPEDLYAISGDENNPEPTLPKSRSAQIPQPQIFSDTLAPPQSSSSPGTPERPVRKPRTKASIKSKPRPQPRRKQPQQKSPIPAAPSSNPTSAQTSPARPAARKPLTTATLQNLLPKRRARPKPKGDFDIPSSSDVELDNRGLGEDEDELSFHATSKMRQKKKKAATRPQKRVAKDMGKENMPMAGKGKTVSRTYTRKSIVESDLGSEIEGSDGEAEEQHIGAGRKKMMPGWDEKARGEMKRMAEKFREVDAYALDFEDMTGSSSQMKDAR